MRNTKKIFAFILVIMMVAMMWVSVAAKDPNDPDACNCEEPRLENPEYDVYREAWDECCDECHTMLSYAVYDCSRCGQYVYVPDALVQEEHTWIYQWTENIGVNNTKTVVDECKVCGRIRRTVVPLN